MRTALPRFFGSLHLQPRFPAIGSPIQSSGIWRGRASPVKTASSSCMEGLYAQHGCAPTDLDQTRVRGEGMKLVHSIGRHHHGSTYKANPKTRTPPRDILRVTAPLPGGEWQRQNVIRDRPIARWRGQRFCSSSKNFFPQEPGCKRAQTSRFTLATRRGIGKVESYLRSCRQELAL